MPHLQPCKVMNHFGAQASYEAAVNENPHNRNVAEAGGRKKRGVASHSKFWANGKTLRIAFINPPSVAHRLAAIEAIKQWQPSINLSLVFEDNAESDIRISMDPPLNYSAVGTDASLRAADENTMNIGTALTHPRFESTVLHEFGHALGMEHEHLHPNANIPWNKTHVYHYYLTHFGWPKEEVDHNFFQTLEAVNTRSTPYDPTSIMHYPIINELTVGDWSVERNTTISQKDRRLMRKIYPK